MFVTSVTGIQATAAEVLASLAVSIVVSTMKTDARTTGPVVLAMPRKRDSWSSTPAMSSRESVAAAVSRVNLETPQRARAVEYANARPVSTLIQNDSGPTVAM